VTHALPLAVLPGPVNATGPPGTLTSQHRTTAARTAKLQAAAVLPTDDLNNGDHPWLRRL